MAKKKKNTQKGYLKLTNVAILIVIIALLVILSYALSFIFIDDASTGEKVYTKRSEQVTNGIKRNVNIVTPLEGTWYSSYDGSILTVTGTSFKLEKPSVDAGNVIQGELTFLDKEVVIVYKKGSGTCKGIKGKYKWKPIGKYKLELKLISDKCKNRAERFSVQWEKI